MIHFSSLSLTRVWKSEKFGYKHGKQTGLSIPTVTDVNFLPTFVSLTLPAAYNHLQWKLRGWGKNTTLSLIFLDNFFFLFCTREKPHFPRALSSSTSVGHRSDWFKRNAYGNRINRKLLQRHASQLVSYCFQNSASQREASWFFQPMIMFFLSKFFHKK